MPCVELDWWSVQIDKIREIKQKLTKIYKYICYNNTLLVTKRHKKTTLLKTQTLTDALRMTASHRLFRVNRRRSNSRQRFKVRHLFLKQVSKDPAKHPKNSVQLTAFEKT